MKIVLTGGPSAGKTSICEVLLRSHWDRLAIVPEAAAILFRGGFPRDTLSEVKQRCQQRAVYHVQKELEEIAFLESTGRSMVCDRGSLDGLAYWPGSEKDFFAAMGSDKERELSRYDWVLHLETAHTGYKAAFPRTENQKLANELNERVKRAWSSHPRQLLIVQTEDFVAKVEATVKTVEMILDGVSLHEIRGFLNSSNESP